MTADNRPVKDKATIARIRSLVIPPAWTQVWICPDECGHLQAIGRDARGRKQYRYHPRYRMHRDEKKYERLTEFANRLPKLRRAVAGDLAAQGLGARKVLATVTRLLEVTCIRIGNAEYERQNKSFGLTTLKDKHVDVGRERVRFNFRGKSGVEHTIHVADPRLARIVKRCRDLPGQELFQYVNDRGESCTVESSMVNDYIREAMGEEFTAKDFRTWHGTVQAAMALGACPLPDTKKELTRVVAEAVRSVASYLGNRPATCRKFYIHPEILSAFQDGGLATLTPASAAELPDDKLSPVERCVLKLLEERTAPRSKAA